MNSCTDPISHTVQEQQKRQSDHIGSINTPSTAGAVAALLLLLDAAAQAAWATRRNWCDGCLPAATADACLLAPSALQSGEPVPFSDTTRTGQGLLAAVCARTHPALINGDVVTHLAAGQRATYGLRCIMMWACVLAAKQLWRWPPNAAAPGDSTCRT